MKLINTSYPLLENQPPLELSLSPSSTYTCIDLFVKHNIYQTHHFIFHGHASVLVINPHSPVEKKMEEQVNGKKQRKQKSKVAAEGVETDYVRVKARRGQATDSHSLAERARRAKIRMRMKLLQSLVPGCDKITGKAHILDAIIKYVQLLQNQVESLAAKLAFVDLMLFDCEPNPSANPYDLEGLYHYEPPLPSLPESSSIPFMSFADAAPSDSASLLLTEDQRASLVLQDGENFLLDMDDQYRGDIVDQPEAGLDNLCTF